jgi:hypothetical protein
VLVDRVFVVAVSCRGGAASAGGAVWTQSQHVSAAAAHAGAHTQQHGVAQDGVSQNVVVSRGIAALVQLEPSNVLALGYRPRRLGSNNGLAWCPSVENHFPNTMASHLMRAEWRELLMRIGACLVCRRSRCVCHSGSAER